MPLSDELIGAYRAARYVVFAGNGPVMRIGEPCPEIDELLAEAGELTAAFLTAANPRGERRSENENALAMDSLKRFLNEKHYRYHSGEGRDPEDAWPPEASVLILGVSRAQAESLGHQFGQNAIVFVERGRAPELVVLV